MAEILDAPAALTRRGETLTLVDAIADPQGAIAQADMRLDFGGASWRWQFTLPGQSPGEDSAALRAFINSLRVADRIVRMSAPNQQDNAFGSEGLAAIALDGPAVAMAKTVDLKSMTPGAGLKAGSFVNVGEHLHELQNDVVADGSGRAQATFNTRLRAAFPDGQAVRLQGVTGVWRLVKPASFETDAARNVGDLNLDFREALRL